MPLGCFSMEAKQEALTFRDVLVSETEGASAHEAGVKSHSSEVTRHADWTDRSTLVHRSAQTVDLCGSAPSQSLEEGMKQLTTRVLEDSPGAAGPTPPGAAVWGQDPTERGQPERRERPECSAPSAPS